MDVINFQRVVIKELKKNIFILIVAVLGFFIKYIVSHCTVLQYFDLAYFTNVLFYMVLEMCWLFFILS
ncbi:hypothetical protein MTR67_051688 [Solanum verrucosum]|uniref:Uncharacterized protein n=1 Tax=Solanum verrucosum TaxID=315347 RepID=A0AAF0V7V8_SOLVR|nr:hypothetical protein MTR67_051688 [Solanum verrucosum]